jgi:hypothetical protein
MGASGFLMKKKALKQENKTLDIFIENNLNVRQLISIALNDESIVIAMNNALPKLAQELNNSLKFMDDLNFVLKELKKRE